MSYLCRYRPDPAGRWFESATKEDERFYVCGVRGDLAGADFEQEKPARVPGQLDRFLNSDLPGTEWQPDPPAVNPPAITAAPVMTFGERLARIFDAIPNAPLSGAVPTSECVWCRITKKAAPWLGFIVVGLIVAWLSRRYIR